MGRESRNVDYLFRPYPNFGFKFRQMLRLAVRLRLAFSRARIASSVHHNKGVCLRHLGKVVEAEQYFRTALSLDPCYHYSLEELQRLSVG
jgi:Tfp pilus assembly protein PilF